jgi:hypothetical protein
MSVTAAPRRLSPTCASLSKSSSSETLLRLLLPERPCALLCVSAARARAWSEMGGRGELELGKRKHHEWLLCGCSVLVVEACERWDGRRGGGGKRSLDSTV